MNWRYVVMGVMGAVIYIQHGKIDDYKQKDSDHYKEIAASAINNINTMMIAVDIASKQKTESKIDTVEVIKYVQLKAKDDMCYNANINSDAYERMHERNNQVRASAKQDTK